MQARILLYALVLAFVGSLSTVNGRAVLSDKADVSYDANALEGCPKGIKCFSEFDSLAIKYDEAISPILPRAGVFSGPHEGPGGGGHEGESGGEESDPGGAAGGGEGGGSGGGEGDSSGGSDGEQQKNPWEKTDSPGSDPGSSNDGSHESTSSAMSDADEANPHEGSPVPEGTPLDPNQAIYNQRPSPEFRDLFAGVVAHVSQNKKADKVLFWSGDGEKSKLFGYYGNAADYHALKTNQYSFSELVKTYKEDTGYQIRSDNFHREESGIASAALARAARGEIEVMMPARGLKGENGQGTTFTNWEFPELVRPNGPVTKISRVDPDTEELTLLWQREDEYDGPFPLDTPITDGIFPLKKKANS